MRTPAAKPYSKLVAMLGPTNTGKTHRAIGRMLEHPTGMLGLPLRLLAREVYDRLTRELGEHAVALITGEEKRVGRRARYWVCTVEAMPMSQEVDFLAVDEVQLAAHPRRGHVFTDRLLHARGRAETWFMGADTMRPLLRAILPTATFQGLPRLSTLKSSGQLRLGALPLRSAVVAFSVPEVYRLAERLRHRKGGAAVVLGALSPRARNAQVALYEAREVDYLVATDAIGMGLNLGISHVAFASVNKFDGREARNLELAELAQIAGRAGRYLENGTFGTLAPLPAFTEGVARRIEQHRFDSVQAVSWRNTDLDFTSLAELLASLEAAPRRRFFRRVVQSSDSEALQRLALDPDVRRRAQSSEAVQTLWATCQIPDYQQSLPELHARLVKEVFLQLTGPKNRLDPDWLAASIQPLADVTGDVEALTARIAAVRTWTYLSHQHAWVPEEEHWREHTRDVEDRLSDALHERLVERFVTRRHGRIPSAALPPRAATAPLANESESPFSVLASLRQELFTPEQPLSLERWVEDLVAAGHDRFHLDEHGHIYAGEHCVARWVRGTTLLRPEVKLLTDELDSGQALRLSRRLLAWSRDVVDELVGGLRAAPNASWSASARGLLYQLEQSLGSLPVLAVREQLSSLTESDRAALAERGVELGQHAVYMASSFGLVQRVVRAALTRTFSSLSSDVLADVAERTSCYAPKLEPDVLHRLGFIRVGPRAVRADAVEELSRTLARATARGPFAPPESLAATLELSVEELLGLAQSLGYRRSPAGLERPRRRKRRRRRRPAPRACSA